MQSRAATPFAGGTYHVFVAPLIELPQQVVFPRTLRKDQRLQVLCWNNMSARERLDMFLGEVREQLRVEVRHL